MSILALQKILEEERRGNDNPAEGERGRRGYMRKLVLPKLLEDERLTIPSIGI